LEGDAKRPVTWLRVVDRRTDSLAQAPLPHPPDAIDPALLAVAAANLIEHVLRVAAGSAGPGTEPPSTPAQVVETVAPPAAPAPAVVARAAPTRAGEPSVEPVPAVSAWFVQVGVVLALAHLHSGMEAASRPREDQVLTSFGDRRFFTLGTAWVPDGDSFDDYEGLGFPRGVTPVPGNCPADGTPTGPTDLVDANGEPFTTYAPSSYCARVASPGFAFVPALRVVVGRWILPRVALALRYQGHFGIDAQGFFGSQLFGMQGELLVLGARGQGLSLSVLAALTAGRTETPVPAPGPASAGSTNALSGPLGVEGGVQLRAFPMREFALFASPTVGQRFPAMQTTLDLSAGVEVPF
jgi:hypothetical protein